MEAAASETDPCEAIWETIELLQNSHVPHCTIIEALLFEASWMIDAVCNDDCFKGKRDEMRKAVSDFSWHCAKLVADPPSSYCPPHMN